MRLWNPGVPGTGWSGPHNRKSWQGGEKDGAGLMVGQLQSQRGDGSGWSLDSSVSWVQRWQRLWGSKTWGPRWLRLQICIDVMRLPGVLLLSFPTWGKNPLNGIHLGTNLLWVREWGDTGKVLSMLFYVFILGFWDLQGFYCFLIVTQSFVRAAFVGL